MAIIKPPFEIVGSIRGVSFYKQYGSDKVIMRTKGGATKQKIKTSPKFANLRLHQTEWGLYQIWFGKMVGVRNTCL